MSNFLINIFFIFALLFGSKPISNELADAFKNGNAEKVSSYFGESVDFSIPKNEGVYSRTQAKLILKTFFTENKPSEFKIMQNGASKNNAQYTIGALKTSTNLFRVYILYKKDEHNKSIVSELRIESQE